MLLTLHPLLSGVPESQVKLAFRHRRTLDSVVSGHFSARARCPMSDFRSASSAGSRSMYSARFFGGVAGTSSAVNLMQSHEYAPQRPAREGEWKDFGWEQFPHLVFTGEAVAAMVIGDILAGNSVNR